MSSTTTVAELAALTEPQYITRENVDSLLDRGQIEIQMKSRAWWSIRRNGATKHWKRDPARIYIPFKYGHKFYGYLTEVDFMGPNGSLLLEYFRVKPSIN